LHRLHKHIDLNNGIADFRTILAVIAAVPSLLFRCYFAVPQPRLASKIPSFTTA
jgi:hypothetical protein